MKRTILMLTVVSLLVAIPALAKNNVPGDVPAPTWAVVDPAVPVDFVNGDIVFDWTDAAGAEKYSLCIEGVLEVDYTDDNGTPDIPEDDTEYLDVEVEFSVCFGTSDRTDGGEMGDSDLAIPVEEFFVALEAAAEAAALDQLGISLDDADDVELIALTAKVKGLDPHDKNDMKRQNNLFSPTLDLLAILIP
jgi:hypothetical protein